MEPWDALKDFEPCTGITPNLDLRFDGSKRVEGLIEQVAHHANLRPVTGRPDVVDGQSVVDAQVTLDETGHLPVVQRTVEAFQDEDVTPAGGATIAFAAALLIWMCQGRGDRIAQPDRVTRLGGADAIRQPSFFHACPSTA
jgi:hypothetical protein